MPKSKFKPCVNDPNAITVPTWEEYAATHASVRQSGKWTSDNTNEALKAGGSILSSLLDIFKPADQNTTYVMGGGGNNNNQKDNTMLYVGIGGVVLVVILFAVIALKK